MPLPISDNNNQQKFTECVLENAMTQFGDRFGSVLSEITSCVFNFDVSLPDVRVVIWQRVCPMIAFITICWKKKKT